MKAKNRYGEYCIPVCSVGRPAAKKILKGGVYEPKTIDYIFRHCGYGDVVHAGAFFGDFLPALSQAVVSDAIIFAIEPNPVNYHCAKETLRYNNINNVVLQNVAIGAKEGRERLLIMNANGDSLGGASMIVDDYPEGFIVYVDVVTLDGVIPRITHISLIHLDVEGYEQQTLMGAINTIRRCKPVLILEDNKGMTKGKWFRDNILSQGYKFVRKIHNNKVYES